MNMATYSLKHLFAPHILQSRIQVLDLLHQRFDFVLVRALDTTRFANGQIEGKLDGAMDGATQPAASAGDVLGCDADAVLATVGGAEGKFALGGAALGDYTVVVVKGFLDADKDADVGFGLVCFGCVVPGFGVVVA